MSIWRKVGLVLPRNLFHANNKSRRMSHVTSQHENNYTAKTVHALSRNPKAFYRKIWDFGIFWWLCALSTRYTLESLSSSSPEKQIKFCQPFVNYANFPCCYLMQQWKLKLTVVLWGKQLTCNASSSVQSRDPCHHIPGWDRRRLQLDWEVQLKWREQKRP